MTRDRREREQNRADLLAVLAESGPTMTGDLIAAAYGLTEVMTGSPIHVQGTADLRALEHARLIRPCLVDRCFGGYELATAETVADDEDAAEVDRMMAGWQEATG